MGSRFLEPSDWLAVRLVSYDLTGTVNGRRVSARMLAALWSGMGDLLTTEAARRPGRDYVSDSGLLSRGA